MSEEGRPRAGEKVVLVAIPPGLLEGLPAEDQAAIRAVVGKPVTFVGYDDRGWLELHFANPFDSEREQHSHAHSIWVAPEFIERGRA